MSVGQIDERSIAEGCNAHLNRGLVRQGKSGETVLCEFQLACEALEELDRRLFRRLAGAFKIEAVAESQDAIRRIEHHAGTLTDYLLLRINAEPIMNHHASSLRPFIGSKDFEQSRKFYGALGFAELRISTDMSLFRVDNAISFYLQDYFVKDWIDNLMLFLEVDNLDEHHTDLTSLELPKTFHGVRVSSIQVNEWGREYFVHDPSGVLWHFGQFASPSK